MSLFYLNVSTISRGQNQSAVASASYRSGESLYSELDMETKSYKQRSVEPDSFILAPEYAPDWVYERERLWNEVEIVESRGNSRLAREITVALPIELTDDLQKEMLKEYVEENFTDEGMVADVSIHRDVSHNPHAHILLTTRSFDHNGEWEGKKKREYIKDDNDNFVINDRGERAFKTISITDWSQTSTLNKWRENYAEIINDYYKNNDIQSSVSHKSYEDQGLDKVAQHRLSLAEYNIEKREKERAEERGDQYVPVTKYGKMNNEIKQFNKELEVISKKVVSLEEYREEVKGSVLEQLKGIRNNFELDNDDYIALKVVAKRTKGYVDLPNSKDNLNRLQFWEQKLINERIENTSFGMVLEESRNAFNNNPKDVLNYGFVPQSFKENFNSKVKSHTENIDHYNKKIDAYNEMYIHSNRAYGIQKQFTNEEFNFIYPEYADKLSDNDKVIKLKSFYVEDFKERGVLHDSITEIDAFAHKYEDVYVEAEELLSDWKETTNSLLILERTRNKQQRDYGEQYTGWNDEETFNKSVQFTNVKEQIKERESNKDNLEGRIGKHLKVIYPGITDETLGGLTSTSKSRLLELYVDDRSSGLLSKDMKLIEDDIKRDFEKDQHGTEGSFESGTSNASDLFSMLVNNAQRDESQQGNDDLRRRRIRRRKGKVRGYRIDMDEREL